MFHKSLLCFCLLFSLPLIAFSTEPAMKILGPNGQDITGNIQELLEDNPLMVSEFSRAFDKIEAAANQLAESKGEGATEESDTPPDEVAASESSDENGGGSGDATADAGDATADAGDEGATDGDGEAVADADGEEGEGAASETEQELFVKWTVQINENGTMGLIDQGNPEVNAQFPVGGGARMFNVCTMREITKSIGGGAKEGTLTQDDLPSPDNGFSSGGFGTTWTNNTPTNGAYGGDVSVTTSGNKVDLAVLDITPPELFISLDASDGRASSVINVKSSLAHEPVVSIPEDSTPRDFYKDQDATPFQPDQMLSQGFVKGKSKVISAEGSIFNPDGEYTKLESNIRSDLIPGTKNFNAKFIPENLGDIKAIYVPENVRLKIVTQAIDADEDFDQIHPEPGEDLNTYNNIVNNIGQVYQNYRRDVTQNDSQVNHIFKDNSDNTATFPGIKDGTLQWKIIQKDGTSDMDYAVPTDPKAPLYVIFRQSDYTPGVDLPNANFFLVSEVQDEAGNSSSIRIPIWVTPTSFESRSMQDGRN